MKFEPNQLVKCPYTGESLKIVRVLTCEYEGWFNLYVVDASGAEDFVLHTPNNPIQIIE